MKCLDRTQAMLVDYLVETEQVLNRLLAHDHFNGHANILTNLDLGFPHDVIRLAGGFATGIAVSWYSNIPFIPIDICMNACTVSLYQLEGNDSAFFNKKSLQTWLGELSDSSYRINFQRGNHFVSLLEDIEDKKLYLMIHSSAAEFETMFNGLYPVEGNFFHQNTKVYYANNRYVRYIDGIIAELYLKISDNLYQYNENRHDFFAAALLKNPERIIQSNHYHHYGMPTHQTALLGSHLLSKGQLAPLLTRPGMNIYLIRYIDTIDNNLRIPPYFSKFITPHGWGKHHINDCRIQVDCSRGVMMLDEIEYRIKYGESLRAHPGLELRNIKSSEYFSKFSNIYDFEIAKEFRQIASYNKSGFINW